MYRSAYPNCGLGALRPCLGPRARQQSRTTRQTPRFGRWARRAGGWSGLGRFGAVIGSHDAAESGVAWFAPVGLSNNPCEHSALQGST